MANDDVSFEEFVLSIKKEIEEKGTRGPTIKCVCLVCSPELYQGDVDTFPDCTR